MPGTTRRPNTTSTAISDEEALRLRVQAIEGAALARGESVPTLDWATPLTWVLEDRINGQIFEVDVEPRLDAVLEIGGIIRIGERQRPYKLVDKRGRMVVIAT